MSKKNSAGPRADAANTPTLSAADCKALELLQKGCAYHVHGVWRFRGVRTPIKEAILVSLMEKGLAMRVETDGPLQFQITEAGRAYDRKNLRREADSNPGTAGCLNGA